MARVALLIGTGEYTEGFKPLPAAPKDVEAIAAVLADPEMGGFDQVDTLTNKPYTEIAETIETWFRERQKDDLALLYISGHGVKDAQLDLYFAASNTRKQKEDLVRATAISASFVRDRIRESKAKRQIIILDCCFSGAFGDLLARDDDSIDLESLLGAEGRVVLTSSSSIQYSFEQRDQKLSIYTRYLVEGIRTGAADVDNDGAISVQELHDYAKRKVQEESPAMTPKIIVLKDEGYQIRIAKAPLGDPKVKYRKEVEAIVQEDGDTIDEILSRRVLKGWQRRLGLTDAEVQSIEAEILEPIRQRQEKLQEYHEAFIVALQQTNPLGERQRKRLNQLQQVLGLLDENVQVVEDEVMAQILTITLDQHEMAFISPGDDISESPSGTDKDSLLDELFREDTTDEDSLLDELFGEDTSEPSPNQVQLPEDELTSEKGIDYTRLRDLLKAKKWQEADRETADRILQAIDKDAWRNVQSKDLLNFPCKDLRTIDRLWVKYSNGKFGFSVQKQIYVECGAKPDGKYPGDTIWDEFCDRVGWRKNGKYTYYSDLKFNPYFSPKGELPVVWWWREAKWGNELVFGGGGLFGWIFLFSRVKVCKL